MKYFVIMCNDYPIAVTKDVNEAREYCDKFNKEKSQYFHYIVVHSLHNE